MATVRLNSVLHHIRRAVVQWDGAGLSDGQLLECFLTHRQGEAIAALVRRHGPMVWGVCRRFLHCVQDAEDAFQATFLVLLRKASSVQPREMLVNWLYGVAYQTARKARAGVAKRGQREKQVARLPEPAAPEENLWRSLQPILDEELTRLPDKYRAAILLCDVEGVTRKEAARRLGMHEEALSGRLTRGRTLLASRMTRHGLTLSGGALATMLTQQAAMASAPSGLAAATIQIATLFVAGPAVPASLVSPAVTHLMEGVLAMMSLFKLKIATALLAGVALAVCLALPGSSTSAQPRSTKPALFVDGSGLTSLAPDKDDKENKNTLITTHRDKLVLTASSVYAGWPLERLVDGKPDTSWFSENNDSVAKGAKPWVQIEFPEDVKVSRVNVLGNREESFLKDYSVLEGMIEFLDKDGKKLWTEEAKATGDLFDFEFKPKKPIEKVRSIKFTSLKDEGDQNPYGDIGLAEIMIE